MLFQIIFKLLYVLRNFYKLGKRLILSMIDKTMSQFYPYVWRRVGLEYVPEHVLLTGGLIPHSNQAKNFKNLASAIATGYDCQINLFTLHLPYAMWSYEDVSALSGYLNSAFKQLNYRPFISFIQHQMDDHLLIDNTQTGNFDELRLQGQNATILILSPNVQCSNLQSAQLVIQLMDSRHSNDIFIKQFLDFQQNEQPVQLARFYKSFHGISLDSSNTYNKLPDLVINFGGDFNKTLLKIPFWMLRRGIIMNTGTLKSFYQYSLIRQLYYFDRYKSQKQAAYVTNK